MACAGRRVLDKYFHASAFRNGGIRASRFPATDQANACHKGRLEHIALARRAPCGADPDAVAVSPSAACDRVDGRAACAGGTRLRHRHRFQSATRQGALRGLGGCRLSRVRHRRWSTSWHRCAASSAAISWPTSCATTPSAGSPPPSTTPAATSSAPSIRASIAAATSTTPTPPIEVGSYTANPDHKSIPVREVPADYWQCLAYHEDRYIGSWLNPYGIDLVGVLKIPYSTVQALDRAEAAEPRRRRLDAADAVRARHLQDAADLERRRLHQAQAQDRRMVAGAGDLSRADPGRRRHAAASSGRRTTSGSRSAPAARRCTASRRPLACCSARRPRISPPPSSTSSPRPSTSR